MYLSAIAQSSYPHIEMKVIDYHSGFFHSSAKLHVIYHNQAVKREFDVDQAISNGPFVYDSEAHHLYYMQAAITSWAVLPKDTQDYTLTGNADNNMLFVTTYVAFGGSWSGNYMIPDMTFKMINGKWQNLQGSYSVVMGKLDHLGDFHIQGSADSFELKNFEGLSIQGGQILFESVISAEHSGQAKMLNSANISDASLQLMDGSDLTLNNIDVQSQLNWMNNKMQDASLTVTDAGMLVNKIGGEAQQIQANQLTLNASFDFTKMPVMTVKYDTAVNAISTFIDSNDIKLSGVADKGVFVFLNKDSWNLSNLFNLSELTSNNEKVKFTLSGLKDSITATSDAAHTIKIQHVLNNDMVFGTIPDAEVKFELPGIKIQNEVAFLADGSASTSHQVLIPSCKFYDDKEVKFALTNLNFSAVEAIDKNLIMSADSTLNVNQLTAGGVVYGPIDFKGQVRAIKWAYTDRADFIIPLLHDRVQTTVYPDSHMANSFVVTTPDGKVAFDDDVKWDTKGPLVLDNPPDVTKSNPRVSPKLIVKVSPKLIVRAHIAFPKKLLDPGVSEVGVPDEKGMALMMLDPFISSGLIRTEGLNYISDITYINGVLKANGKLFTNDMLMLLGMPPLPNPSQ